MGKHVIAFADYINESVTANKVVAYHGTPHGKFDAFSYDHRGSGADQTSFGDYGKGFYFSPRKSVALGYAKNLSKAKRGDQPYLYTVHLTMNKPFNMGILSDYQAGYMKLMTQYGWGKAVPADADGELLCALGTTQHEIAFMEDIAGSMFDNWGDWDIPGMLANEGYDCIIDMEDKEYIVFDPTQIEILSAEPM